MDNSELISLSSKDQPPSIERKKSNAWHPISIRDTKRTENTDRKRGGKVNDGHDSGFNFNTAAVMRIENRTDDMEEIAYRAHSSLCKARGKVVVVEEIEILDFADWRRHYQIIGLWKTMLSMTVDGVSQNFFY